MRSNLRTPHGESSINSQRSSVPSLSNGAGLSCNAPSRALLAQLGDSCPEALPTTLRRCGKNMERTGGEPSRFVVPAARYSCAKRLGARLGASAGQRPGAIDKLGVIVELNLSHVRFGRASCAPVIIFPERCGADTSARVATWPKKPESHYSSGFQRNGAFPSVPGSNR